MWNELSTFQVKRHKSCFLKRWNLSLSLSVCLDTTYFAENWKLITENKIK